MWFSSLKKFLHTCVVPLKRQDIDIGACSLVGAGLVQTLTYTVVVVVVAAAAAAAAAAACV